MKLNTTKLMMICAAFFLLAAFNLDNENKTEIDDNVDRYESCFGSLVDSTYKIDQTDAMGYINGYKAYIEDVKIELDKEPNAFPHNNEKLIYGVGTSICELKKIIASSTVQDSSEVWIMMGMMDSTKTEMIFALEGIDSSHQRQWQFFDFTRPCPNSCPSW